MPCLLPQLRVDDIPTPARNYDHLPPVRVSKHQVIRCSATLEVADPRFDADRIEADDQAFPVSTGLVRRKWEGDSAIRWQASENFESFHWGVISGYTHGFLHFSTVAASQ